MQREKMTLLKRLRKNVKHVFRLRPRKRDVSVEQQNLEDLMEFSGLPEPRARVFLRRELGSRISDELNWIRPQSEGEYTWFYRGSRTYLFENGPAWERAVALAQPGERVLDFGGGGGRNTLAFAEKGCHASYVDLGIVNAGFVAFRARKLGLPVTVIDPVVQVEGSWRVDTAEAAKVAGPFDLIVCDNVLEHVPNYHDVLAKLASALAPGGRILECTPFKREKVYVFKREKPWTIHLPPSMPMSAAMAKAGLVSAGEEGLWVAQ